MILAALAPALAAIAIFVATLRQRGPSQKEREEAARRPFDGERAAKTALVIFLVSIGLLVVATLHLFVAPETFVPLELS